MPSPFQVPPGGAPLLAQARGQYPGYTLQAYRQNPSAYPDTQAALLGRQGNLATRQSQFQADPQGTMLQRQAGRQAYRADPMAYPETYALLNPMLQQLYNQAWTRQQYLQNPSLYPNTMTGLGQASAQAPGMGTLWNFMANPASNPQVQAAMLQASLNRQARWPTT